MTHSTDISTLVRWMAADFSNQEQAFENPPLFAQIRVCMRPLPYELLSGYSVYLEQAYAISLNQPYRTRVLKFAVVDDRIQVENYAIRDKEEFFGASRDRERLAKLSGDRLEKLSGCNFIVEWTGQSFKAVVEPGKACMVERNGKNTYLDSTFEVSEKGLMSLDRGRDPQTDEHVWGSIAGPFEFARWTSFADEVVGRLG
ncbi:MAG: chromophore lyase CpcT/CpeT [Cyanobacteriota bacterium]|nr:chromophore lyase CpcT/CpeT [Cyanobacteriota bacterium]